MVGITEKEDSRHEPLPSVLESTIIMGIAFLMVFGRKSTETSSWSRRPEHKHEHDHSNKNHDSEHSGSGIIEFQDHLVALVLLGGIYQGTRRITSTRDYTRATSPLASVSCASPPLHTVLPLWVPGLGTPRIHGVREAQDPWL